MLRHLSIIAAGLALTAGPRDLSAQTWTFHTRAQISGQSHGSDPAGYKVYSGIALGAALTGEVSQSFAVEIGVRAESREVDQAIGTAPDIRLGSLEMVPITALFQWRPATAGRLHPYVGAGASLTVGWEKSGALDNLDISPSFAPALQLGVDWRLSERLLLNLDTKWNGLTTDLSSGGNRVARIQIDPLTLGLGIGFRF
jgi:outer membrane protein W